MNNEITVECLCEDSTTHPDGDTITFFPKLDFDKLATVRWAIGLTSSTSVPVRMAALSAAYVLHCIESWTLRDGKKALPLTEENIRARILANPVIAVEIADVADDLYAPDVIHPLVRKASQSSPALPMEKMSEVTSSTSPTNGTGRNGTRSKPSLTSTTPMVATATTRA